CRAHRPRHVNWRVVLRAGRTGGGGRVRGGPQLGADVVIVGARCAGATLAALLASAGIPTIAVDRAHFPSSTVSTHTMHADALSVLRRTGALGAVESLGAPCIREIVCDYGDFQIVGAPPPI